MGIAGIDSILQTHAPQKLHWKSVAYANETHGSVFFKCVYDGLKFSYDGYNTLIQLYPINGVVLTGKPLHIFAAHDSTTNIRYVIGDSEPTSTSPRLHRETIISDPTQLKIRFFSPHGTYDRDIDVNFKNGTVLPAIQKPKKVKAGGMRYSYYEGAWNKLPDFNSLKPKVSGAFNQNFDISGLPQVSNFACLIKGFLEIEEEGYYTFILSSDDGAKLYIGNELLIDNDGLHDAQQYPSYVVPLKKGFYPIRLEYFQKEGGLSLALYYMTPSTITPVKIPNERMYYE